MATYLLIANGVVQNAIEWDGASNWTPPDGTQLVPYEGRAAVGWAWDGEKAIDPNEPAQPGLGQEQGGGDVIA